jgi:hypothetical protein
MPARNRATEAAAKAAAPRAQGNAAADAAAESAAPSAMPQQLGTGHGAREWSPVGHTQFVRASRSPAQVTQLRYDDENALLAMGILRRPPAYGWREGPQAFPAGFVPDPAALLIACANHGQTNGPENRPVCRCIPARDAQARRSLLRAAGSAMAVLAILGLVFDLLACLLDVLAGAGDGVARSEHVHREQREEHQGERALHGRLLHGILRFVDDTRRPVGASDPSRREAHVELPLVYRGSFSRN